MNLQAQTERESIQRGKIYQRPEHLLKPYEKAINAASEELVTMNPSLIFDRSALFEQARSNKTLGNVDMFSKRAFQGANIMKQNPAVQNQRILFLMIEKTEFLRSQNNFK